MSRGRSIAGAIATLVLIVVMVGCNRSRDAKEALLRDDLLTLRSVINQFTLDKQRPPESLQEVVEAGYLKELPVDPFTNSRATWRVVREDVMRSIGHAEPGITDVHSGASGSGSDGRAYSEW